jgi:SSS family solute:Na+ symporter
MIPPFLIMLAVLFVIYAILGVLAYRIPAKSLSDLYLAGRGIGAFALFMTMGATAASSYSLMGAYGYYYLQGSGFLVWPLSQIPLVVSTWIVGKKIFAIGRKYQHETLADIFGHYYKSEVAALLSAILVFLGAMFYTIAQVVGLGWLFMTLAGIPLNVTILVVLAIMGVYCTLGGLRSVVWCDIVNGLIFCIIVVGAMALLLPPALEKGFFAAIPATHFTTPGPLGVWTASFAFSWTTFMFWAGAVPWYVQRFLAAKDLKAARVGAIGGVFLSAFTGGIVGPILAYAMLAYMPGVKAPSDQIPLLIVNKLSPIFAAIYGIGVWAAAVSTADSCLVVAAQALARDFWHRFVTKIKKGSEVPAEKVARVGRLMVIVTTIISAAIGYGALLSPELMTTIIMFTAIAWAMSFPFFLAFIGMYWYPSLRISKEGFIAASILFPAIAIPFQFGLGVPKNPFGIIGYAWGALISGVVAYIISIFTKRPPKELYVKE